MDVLIFVILMWVVSMGDYDMEDFGMVGSFTIVFDYGWF